MRQVFRFSISLFAKQRIDHRISRHSQKLTWNFVDTYICRSNLFIVDPCILCMARARDTYDMTSSFAR